MTRQFAFQEAQYALTRRGGAWKIIALVNVTLVDPRTGQPVLRD